jgi:hypothetical protein
MGFLVPPKYPVAWLLSGGDNPLTNALGGIALALPPPPPPPLTNALNTLLGMVSQRPRSRSEWEARFVYWQKPASDTEEAEIEAKARRVKLALERHSNFLPTRQWQVVKQGSYHNNTNVRNQSDVDLAVCLTDVFFVDGPANDIPTHAELGREPITFSFDDYKAHLAWCLTQEFGSGAVKVGKKAIEIHKGDSDKINADVVPAFTFQLYGPRQGFFRGTPHSGVALLTNEGRRITNFPGQHYTNGCAKNDRTGRRYKRVVRILKRMRDHMAENPSAGATMRASAKSTASFLIESLVYNCPDNLFGRPQIYDDVVAVLRHLSFSLTTPSNALTLLSLPLWSFWYEVNGIKPLFGSDQAWNVSGAASFITFARAYMEV